MQLGSPQIFSILWAICLLSNSSGQLMNLLRLFLSAVVTLLMKNNPVPLPVAKTSLKLDKENPVPSLPNAFRVTINCCSTGLC
jgi:hypothetical protein